MTTRAPAASPFYAPWQKPKHAEFFDALADWSDSAIRTRFESFNDVRLLIGNKPYRNARLLEVGCATGDLYRYLARFHPEFGYAGIDISVPAVERARHKFPQGRFEVVDVALAALPPACANPGVLYCKDVVPHQTDPFGFIRRVLGLPEEAAVMRLRTRDRGATVLDPALSRQRHYDDWVPYMVLNIDEVIAAVRALRPAKQIVLMRHHTVLGGRHGRLLPDDCADPATGTAETALFVRFAAPGDGAAPEIRVIDAPETSPAYTPWQRVRRQVRLRVPGGRCIFRN